MARPEDVEGLEDHVRMYLREIGLVPLLSWDGEKRLARRMEEGIYLERLAREVQDELQQADREATALEVMAELERRFVARFPLLAHWFPTLEATPRRATATAIVDARRDRRDLGRPLPGARDAGRDALTEARARGSGRAVDALPAAAGRGAGLGRRRAGPTATTGPLTPIVGRALTVDPRVAGGAFRLGPVRGRARPRRPDRGEPAPGGQRRQEVHRARHVAAGPDPGRATSA